jgi:hypothetical protein
MKKIIIFKYSLINIINIIKDIKNDYSDYGLSVCWFNLKFRFCVWLLNAKRMKVTQWH